MNLTIENGTSVSPSINLNNTKVLGIFVPSNWTSAPISFLCSADGVNYFPLYVAGDELVEETVAGIYISLEPDYFNGIDYLIVRSGTSSTPINQVSDVILNIIVKYKE